MSNATPAVHDQVKNDSLTELRLLKEQLQMKIEEYEQAATRIEKNVETMHARLERAVQNAHSFSDELIQAIQRKKQQIVRGLY